MNDQTPAPSDRTRLRRYNWLARYDRETIDAIIDASYVCQLGYAVEGVPIVTPTCHWRIGDHLYWHGSSASRMLRAMAGGTPVCFSVTLLDGIVFSRAAFNHNVLYRSVMAFGTTELVPEAEKREVLEVFVNRLAPGLWQAARAPADQEWKASKVIRMKLDEVSAKVAAGLPDEEESDLAGTAWAGHVPIWTTQGAPVPDPKLRPGIGIPDYVRNFRYPGARD
ncbi:pyridoxamine 5'-phosphate oxidase family protein [Cereibacter sphaeroides]|uniref:pyridoxamine 5'-phosphate oxidase family protein n=1 Tax=Cereibacter sphaeroides TaxID=1063 RepID=UPI00313C0C7B